MDLCIFQVREHNSFPVGNQQSGIRQLFLDMIRFQTAFRSTVAFGRSSKVRKPSKSANSISFHNSIRSFHQKPASHLFPHSSEPSLSSFQRAISVFIPASHLCLHSSEPARYSNTVPFQYSIITSPFQQ